MDEADDQLELWETLSKDVEEGKEVYPPTGNTCKKRKVTGRQSPARKKPCLPAALGVDNENEPVGFDLQNDTKDEWLQGSSRGQHPLTAEQIRTEIVRLRNIKKEARS